VSAVEEPSLSIEQFEAADIDPQQFDHEAHVYMGWLYVQEYGLAGAIGRFDEAIHKLVIKLGAEDKYHATITWLFLLIIGERVEPDETWQVFTSKNADLITDGHAVLSRYYDDKTLYSERARDRFILPTIGRN